MVNVDSETIKALINGENVNLMIFFGIVLVVSVVLLGRMYLPEFRRRTTVFERIASVMESTHVVLTTVKKTLESASQQSHEEHESIKQHFEKIARDLARTAKPSIWAALRFLAFWAILGGRK